MNWKPLLAVLVLALTAPQADAQEKPRGNAWGVIVSHTTHHVTDAPLYDYASTNTAPDFGVFLQGPMGPRTSVQVEARVTQRFAELQVAGQTVRSREYFLEIPLPVEGHATRKWGEGFIHILAGAGVSYGVLAKQENASAGALPSTVPADLGFGGYHRLSWLVDATGELTFRDGPVGCSWDIASRWTRGPSTKRMTPPSPRSSRLTGSRRGWCHASETSRKRGRDGTHSERS